MKFLLIATLALVVFWLWRHNRDAQKKDRAAAPPAAPRQREAVPAEMVACSVCGVHLPKSEALIGREGVYCSDAHRRQAGAE